MILKTLDIASIEAPSPMPNIISSGFTLLSVGGKDCADLSFSLSKYTAVPS